MLKKILISMIVMAMVFSFFPFYQPSAHAKGIHLLKSAEMQAIMGMGGGGGSDPDPDPDPTPTPTPTPETYWRQGGSGYRTEYGDVQLVAYVTNTSQTLNYPYNETRLVSYTEGNSLSGNVNVLDLFKLGVSYNHTTSKTYSKTISLTLLPRTAFKLYMKQMIDVNYYIGEYVKDYGSRIEVVKTETAEKKRFNQNFKETPMTGTLQADGSIIWD